LNPDQQRALSSFYREEIERHLDLLQETGFLGGRYESTIQPACERFLSQLDRVCWRADFPLVAETLLRSFDTITRLSELEKPASH
jgi:hypothetical protein